MPRIALVSPLGGSGRTATTAHLLSAMAERGASVLGIDLCAQNQLGGYLGLQQPAALGWATSVVAGQWWGEHGLENSAQVAFLPFGQPAPDALHHLAQTWVGKPAWLEWQLRQLELDPSTLVMLDTPVWPAPLAQQAALFADVLLVLLDASWRACQAQPLVRGLLVGVVVCGFDARRPSQREALQTLRKQWGPLLLPYTVHADESLAQAHARGLCVMQHAAQAQSASDLQGVASWLALQCLPAPALRATP